ncbi:MAG TPA: peptide ABC transporter substrate-binding protein, partial [Chloroflexota bacterium]|nr:peptide ABC transporter substrate-binding protein [Chloroflexota bacterium]
MRRFASLGVALALSVSTLVPVAHAQSGKTLVMGFTQEPDTFVAWEGGLYVSQVAANLVYSSLVAYDDVMQPFPDLATDVPTLDNGLAVMVGDGADQHLETTFRIKSNATFSDGTPVTADDVVFSWKLTLNPVWGASAGNDVESKYSDVVKKDDHTVVFKMMSQTQARAAGQADQQGPVLHPFYLFGLPDASVYPSKRMNSLVDFDPQNSPKVKDLQSSVYSREPVGSGPYMLTAWDPGVQMTFKARKDFKIHPVPAIDTIVIRGFEASKETLIAQLQAGDIQTIGSETLDVSDVDAINAIPGVKAYVKAGTTVEHIDFNLDNAILADKTVRKAIAYGIDRQDLVKRVLAGQSAVADSIIPPISPLFNADTTKYAFNPDQARSLLDGAGWAVGSDGIRTKNGQRLSLKYQSTTAGIRQKTMPLVKDQLSKIGVEVNIDQVPAQTYFGSTGPLRRATYELGEYASVGSLDSGVDMITQFGSKFIPTEANNFGGQNYPRWRN